MKKFLSVILALALALTVLPGVALAEEAPAPEYVAQLKKPGEEELSGEKYTSIQAAVEAAEDGDTIVVTASHALDPALLPIIDRSYDTGVLVEGKSVTIDLNGKAISLDYSILSNNMLCGFFSTDNNGHLTVIDSQGGASVSVTATKTVYGLIVNYEGGCSITINGGSYSLDKSSDNLLYSGCGANENEGITVIDGNFYLGNLGEINKDNNGNPWIANVLSQNRGYVEIKGGTFNADFVHQCWGNEVYLHYDKALQSNGKTGKDERWTVVPALAYVEEIPTSTGGYSRNIGYASLEEAFAVTGEDPYQHARVFDTITLLKNCTVNTTPITVDDTITLTVDSEVASTPSVTWNGPGKMFNVLDGKSLTIDAGIYSFNVNEWCANGYAAVETVVENKDGLFKVVEGEKLQYAVPAKDGSGEIVYDTVYIEGIAADGDGTAKGYTYVHPTQDKAIFDWYRTVNTDNSGNLVLTVPFDYQVNDMDDGLDDGKLAVYGSFADAVVVRFDSKGGTDVPTQAYKPALEDSSIIVSEPGDPTKPDYAFAGWWYTEDDQEKKFEFVDGKKEITSSVDLYAKWLPKHTVTFNANGGSPDISTIVVDGEFLPQPEVPTKENYAFGGWYTDDGTFEHKFDFTKAVDTSTTLYAKWLPKHTVTFNANGGSPDGSTVVVDGETLPQSTAPTPTRENYAFGGWYTDSGLISAYDFTAPVTEPFTLYAKWIPKHTVSFVSNEGSEVGPVEVPDGALLTAPTPTRAGYTFAGWYTDETLETAYDYETAVTGDFTLYAKWNVIVYAPAYTVDAPAGVLLNPANPLPGMTVNVTVADIGADGVRVVDAKGNPVRVNVKDGAFSFVMPYGDVDIVPFEVPFTDVAETDYFTEAMLWALANDITEGTSETTFSPEAPCTRAEMVTFLWRAAGCPAPAGAESAFSDIDPEAYYATALLWAEEQGITAGSGDGAFSPNAACDRAQMAVFLQRMAKGKAVSTENSFDDVAADAYYANAVQWALEQGITAGTGEGTYSPDAVCTRAQMVTFLWRACSK